MMNLGFILTAKSCSIKPFKNYFDVILERHITLDVSNSEAHRFLIFIVHENVINFVFPNNISKNTSVL